MQTYGAYAFILAIIIAVIVGLASVAVDLGPDMAKWIPVILVILGAVVGFLNIADKEIARFLLATIAFVVAGAAGTMFMQIPEIGVYIAGILGYIAMVAAPAAVVVGLKEVWNIGSSPVL
jgi:hypothetical protein